MSKIRRERQREQRRVNRREEKLDAKNCFSKSDPTPREAVKNIRKEQKAVS